MIKKNFINKNLPMPKFSAVIESTNKNLYYCTLYIALYLVPGDDLYVISAQYKPNIYLVPGDDICDLCSI